MPKGSMGFGKPPEANVTSIGFVSETPLMTEANSAT